MFLREHALVYLQVPANVQGGVFEFSFVKAVHLAPCFFFSNKGNSRVLFDATQYLESRPFLFIISPSHSEVYSLHNCMATVCTPYGQGIPANSAPPVPIVDQDGTMQTDTYAMFYDSETLDMVSCLRCIGEPLAVPTQRVCTKREFLDQMKHTRKLNIDIFAQASRICLMFKGDKMRWKFRQHRRLRTCAHVEWHATHMDYIMWPELHVHLYVKQKFEAFLDMARSSCQRDLPLQLVANNRSIMALIYKLYMSATIHAQASTEPPRSFYHCD